MQHRSPYITARAHLVHMVVTNETNVLTGLVKSTSSIGCVGAERNTPVDSNAGGPYRCTSGIEYFGAEDGIYIRRVQHW